MTRRRVAVLGALLAVAALVGVGGTPVRAATCSPIRRLDDSVIGGQEILTMVRAERCGRTVWIYQVVTASADGSPYLVPMVEVWRYSRPGSTRPVRSAMIRPPVPGNPPPIRVWRQIPAARSAGWSGYVQVMVRAGGETRVITLRV